MADWGMKISEDGVDVKTATDQQLIISSSFNALKVKMVGVANTTSVAHGLAYKPIYFSMRELDTSSKYGMVGQDYTGGLPYVDATNFVPAAGNNKYYIFYQAGV